MATGSYVVRFGVRDDETVRRALQGMGADGERALRRIERASKAPSEGFRVLRQGSREVRFAMEDMAARAGPAGAALRALGPGGLAAAAGLAAAGVAFRRFLEVAGEVTEIENRIRLVTSSTQELEATQRALADISQQYGSELRPLVELYSRAGLATKELGASQEELLRFTEAVSVSLGISGTSAQAASGALLQLSQAIGAGVVRAEEFNSILEGAPRLAQAAADGIEGMGGSVARLRTAINEGDVSSRQFFDAILSQLPQLQAEFATTEETSTRAFSRLRTGVLELVDAVDDATGASGSYAEIINGMASALDFAAEAVRSLSDKFPALNGFLEANLTIVGTVRQAWSALQAIISKVSDVAVDAFERVSPLVDKMAQLLRTLGLIDDKTPAQIPVPEEAPAQQQRGDGIFGGGGDSFIAGSGGRDVLSTPAVGGATVIARPPTPPLAPFAIGQGSGDVLADIEARREALTQLSLEHDQFLDDTADNNRDFNAELSDSLSAYLDTNRNAIAAAMSGVQVVVDGTADAITEFVQTGRFNFREFAESIQRDLLRIAIRMMLLRAIAGIGGALAGGAAGGAGASGGAAGLGTGGQLVVGTAHTGGVIGVDPLPRRSLPSAMFNHAPRFHRGLMPDEYPAVLQRGEGVFTKGQMAAMGGRGDVQVVINNAPSTPKVTETERGVQIDFEARVDSMVAGLVGKRGSQTNRALGSLGQVTAR